MLCAYRIESLLHDRLQTSVQRDKNTLHQSLAQLSSLNYDDLPVHDTHIQTDSELQEEKKKPEEEKKKPEEEKKKDGKEGEKKDDENKDDAVPEA